MNKTTPRLGSFKRETIMPNPDSRPAAILAYGLKLMAFTADRLQIVCFIRPSLRTWHDMIDLVRKPHAVESLAL
jgi:hypothetical protein